LNRKEYNSVVKSLSHRLYAFLLKNCKNEALVNDLMQDTFEKLWVNRKSVEVEKARQWLFTTGYRLMLNTIKRNQKTELRESISETAFFERKPNLIEQKDFIDHILSLLTEQQRAIILLRDYEGYDYQEIGNILSLSESQVKVYLFRARKKRRNN